MPGTTIILHPTNLNVTDIPAGTMMVVVLGAVLLNLIALWVGQKLADR